MCPGDDVILTCTVTASTNKSGMLFLFFSNAFDGHHTNRVFYDAGSTISANSSTVGLFTTKVVEVSNDSIVATATIKEITSQNDTCTGIKCEDGSGVESVLYVALGKKKS